MDTTGKITVLSLVEQVRKIVAELDGREFTPVEVFEKLQEQFPDKIDKKLF